MVTATVVGLLISVFFPEGDHGHLTYETIGPTRAFFRTWLVLAGVNLVVGLTAFALAGWLLVPSRGWIAAMVVACLMWVGCALYAVGVGGVATLYYFGADPAIFEPSTSARALDRLDDNTLAVWGPALGGAVLTAIGQLALAVGLWRAAPVARWVPILAATIVLTFVLPTAGTAGFFVELPSAIAGRGLAWYLWRGYGRSPRYAGQSAWGRDPRDL
jgi:hypothetical protein